MGKKITITESDLRHMVNETVKKLIKEYYGTFDDTTDAPWNNDNGSESTNSGHIDEFYCDLSAFIEQHPQLRKILLPISNNGDFSECNVGKVDVTWNSYDSDYEHDDSEGYGWFNESEPDMDSIRVSLSDENKLSMVLPDKLVDMLNDAITEEFKLNNSLDDVTK